ncbi:carboxylic ester hydrolase [Plakobranchus ocellatus]|uniref:Carboxylic ester hydrolase n=1 Tax=Plakobranchus ocellatus TaxID=259542 RepID=A0AAV3ZCP2_9GAST|nr:carboxylic ester hydrolase [Plakobranchus ocellatus]
MSNVALPALALFSLVSSILLSIALSASEQATLTTTLGDVTGIKKPAFNRHVEVFYGIPFAKPPVGDRRFRAPQPAEPWGSEPRDGTVKPHACWQSIDTAFERFRGVEMWNPNTQRDEDCLYLNVWRSANEVESSNPKSIMVWIFGGGFWSGSAVLDIYDATQLAARKDVIVVTIAYRLGPLGFMYLNNNDVPGNAGLLDQVLALQWIKDNAVNLGGSPDDITLFGESAGAASIGFHMLSPLSRDLFKNAIMESASPTSYWAVMDTAKASERVAKLAANVSCPTSLGENLLACLQAVDAERLTNQQWILVDKWFDVPIGPIVDGNFLPEHPNDMLRLGNIKMTNVIVGVDKNEGIFWDIYGFMSDFPLNKHGRLNKKQFHKIMRTIADNDNKFARELIQLYSKEPGASRLSAVDAASGDSLFKCSVVDFARQYTEVGGQVYVYSFEENFSSDPWPDWMGVPHGYEIEVVFGLPLAPGSSNTQAEKDLTKKVMQVWTHFAKTGSTETAHVHWPLYSTETEDYVVIDVHGFQTKHRLRKKACQLWATHQQG